MLCHQSLKRISACWVCCSRHAAEQHTPISNRLFPRAPSGPMHKHNIRAIVRRHDIQLVDYCNGTQLCQFQRLLFGLVKVYIALPACFVRAECLSRFQTMLIQASKQACPAGNVGWQDMFASSSLPYALLVRHCFG